MYQTTSMFQAENLRRTSALVIHIWQVIVEKSRRERERKKREDEVKERDKNEK